MNDRFDSLSQDYAKSALAALRDGVSFNAFEYAKETGEGEKFECNVEGLAEELLTLFDECSGTMKEADFESKAVSLLHTRLQLPKFVAGHREFWTWLTFVADGGSFQKVVVKRYSLDAKEVNFGIVRKSAVHEGLFAKLWTRADRFIDDESDDAYHYAKRGGIEFWSSHFFKQDFASCKQMWQAFVEFCYPQKGAVESHYTINYIRALAKLGKARNSVTGFELLTQKECLDIWDEVAEGLGDFGGDKYRSHGKT